MGFVKKEITDKNKGWVVDVPVKYIIWTRPDVVRKVFNIIKVSRPSILFLISDGGRNPLEKEKIAESRRIVSDIDWNCTVYTYYLDDNHGMYTMMKETGKLIFDIVDRCVFLEDDDLPSESFIPFCAEMLERYKDDMRIALISGYNVLGSYSKPSSDYFFSREGSIWGFATWKRTYKSFLDNDLECSNDVYTKELILNNSRDRDCFDRMFENYSQGKKYDGHDAGEEFFQTLSIVSQNQLYIIPKKNLISNIGVRGDGAHTVSDDYLPNGLKKLYNTDTYELGFPLKHPKYVIADEYYFDQLAKRLGVNRPYKVFWWRLVMLIKMIISGNSKMAVSKMNGMLQRISNNRDEN